MTWSRDKRVRNSCVSFWRSPFLLCRSQHVWKDDVTSAVTLFLSASNPFFNPKSESRAKGGYPQAMRNSVGFESMVKIKKELMSWDSKHGYPNMSCVYGLDLLDHHLAAAAEGKIWQILRRCRGADIWSFVTPCRMDIVSLTRTTLPPLSTHAGNNHLWHTHKKRLQPGFEPAIPNSSNKYANCRAVTATWVNGSKARDPCDAEEGVVSSCSSRSSLPELFFFWLGRKGWHLTLQSTTRRSIFFLPLCDAGKRIRTPYFSPPLHSSLPPSFRCPTTTYDSLVTGIEPMIQRSLSNYTIY